jgi:hypothetical protein
MTPPSASQRGSALLEWLKGVDAWWFGKGSPVTLGTFRILMGSLAFVNLAMILVDFDAWFTERGFVPQKVVPIYFGDAARLNLLGGVTDSRVTLAFYLATMVAALLTTVGLFTRASSLLLAVGYITLHHRNPLILHGGDLVVRLGVMYIALAPSGASCSLDRIIGLWKGKIKGPPPEVSLWVQRVLQFEVALVYVTTVWHKSRGHYWIDGTATYYPLHLNEFDRFWLPAFVEENRLFIMVTTYGTLATELALGTIVFYRPLRKWVLLAGVLMHSFIEYAFNIPLFSALMVSTYIAFYEGHEVSAWARRCGERLKAWRVLLPAPEGMRFREGPKAALESLSPFGLVKLAERGEGAVEARSGRSAALLRSPGAWALGWIPGLWGALWRRALEIADRGAAGASLSGKAIGSGGRTR